MEKGFQFIFHRQPRIVITGPESTGKTSLAEKLATHFNGYLVPEFARTYVEDLQRPYSYDDVEKIARHQVRSRNRYTRRYSEWIFFDTDLIITKVWFLEVFKRIPVWVDKNLRLQLMDLYLLCNNDVPWEPDHVRENGGDRRNYLFGRYREELEFYGFQYAIVHGTGPERFNNARKVILDFLEKWTKQ